MAVNDDCIEMRVRSFATVCTECFRLSSLHPTRTSPEGKSIGLLRDGGMHALPAIFDTDKRDVPLCEAIR